MLQDRDYYWRKAETKKPSNFDHQYWRNATKPRISRLWYLMPVVMAFFIIMLVVSRLHPSALDLVLQYCNQHSFLVTSGICRPVWL